MYIRLAFSEYSNQLIKNLTEDIEKSFSDK